jgi:hypothetical protein
MAAVGGKLSYLQEQILRWLLETSDTADASLGELEDIPQDQQLVWFVAKWELVHMGVSWRPSKGAQEWTRSNAAAVSRSIRRLEERGLVRRGGSDRSSAGKPRAPRSRTTRLKLTELGREAAQQLTLEMLTL